MNKYYTPTIEEIISHIISERFIYMNYHPQQDTIPGLESSDPGQLCFSDNIVDSLNSFIKMNDCKTSTKDGSKVYSINPELYKIKYLDKDDIKELGFKEGKLPYQFFDGIHKLVYLGDNKISITHEADDCYLFYGVIKNKSELRKLLIQLGIHNEN